MTDARIIDLLGDRSRQPLLSFEFFPPKDDEGVEQLKEVAHQLKAARPDFVTVTYGAGGSTRERTFEVCAILRDMGFGPVMPHLTCIASTRSDLERISDTIYAEGYRNVMTLRGDPPKGRRVFEAAEGGLSHASELVRLLKQRYPELCCGVAGYPEVHPEAESAEKDIQFLKEKVDAGGSFVTTQLFYDNADYFRFVEDCRKKGIDAPIIPGLLPVSSLKQARRMTTMCGSRFPDRLSQALESAGGEGEEAEAAGIQWAVQQIRELLEHDVPGIHLYILNKARSGLDPTLHECMKQRNLPL
ncbi:MAG: methylenetetrahydrofolate reductase [NAD(P)H] [Verrucomicrobia bacterium]|nr:methylenetetrahydrofolate reductase [NAD(P)H] [Verrucomicrobiota bacterium]